MTESGWVKFYRSINENHFLMKDNNAYIVFTKLLTNAGKSKGEWAGGRRQLAEIVNINDNTLKHVLERLEREHLITRKVTQRYSIITILNWHEYQDSRPTNSPTGDPAVTHTRPSGDHSNKKENRKEKKNVSIIPEQLEPEITEFVKMRKLKRNPMTERAIELLVQKLNRLYPEDYPKQKLCLENSIEGGWTKVYELKAHDLTGGVKRFA
jgi:hypothetical protein